jgi:GntR family transcriptional regulator
MTEPMYRQIAEDLRAKIESGEIGPGEQLPTENQLRKAYEASRNTVRDAIGWLANHWLVETRAGRGTFVVDKVTPFVSTLSGDPESHDTDVYLAEVTAKGRMPQNSPPTVEIQRASDRVARALRVDPGTLVVSRHQERLIDGTPWSLETSFYPWRLVEAGAVKLAEPEDIEEGAVRYLAQQGVIKQVGYRDTIAVRTPDDNEAAFFKFHDDGRVPVYESFRIGFDANGLGFRLTITVYAADRNRFRVDVGDVPPTVFATDDDD